MLCTTISKLKKGDLFRFKDDYNAPIKVRNHYDRSSKTYSYSPYDDFCDEHFAKPSRKVFVL